MNKGNTLKKLKMIFFQGFSIKTDPKIDKEINIDNLQAYAYSALIVSFVGVLYALFSLFFIGNDPSFFKNTLGILIGSVSCIVVFFVLNSFNKWNKKTKRLNNRYITAIIAFMYLFTSIMSVHVDISRHLAGEQMIMFYIIQFSFLLFLNLKPILCTILISLSFGYFLLNVIVLNGIGGFNYASCFMFLGLAIFGNSRKYANRVIRYNELASIEMKEKENEIVIKHSGHYVARYDIKNNIGYNGSKACEFFGFPPIVNDPASFFVNSSAIAEESKEDVYIFYNDMKTGKPSGSGDFKLFNVKGEEIWQHGEYTLQKDDSGEYVISIISFSDITEQVAQRLEYDKRIREIVLLSDDCDFYMECSLDDWIVEKVHNIASIEDSEIESLVGHNIDDIIRKRWKPMILLDDFARYMEFFNKDRLQLLFAKGVSSDKIEFRVIVDGQTVWYSIEICLIRAINTKKIIFYVLFRNINEDYLQYMELLSNATTDKLTGLFTRGETMEQIESFILAEGKRGNHALIMVDLDNLKKINDTLGHQVGDEALMSVGDCLLNTFKKTDVCGRVGGDEFFIFMKDCNVDEVIKKANIVLNELQMTYGCDKNRVIVTVSMGISMYYGSKAPKKTLKDLYAEADAALYKSKVTGKNTFTFSDEVDVLTSSTSEVMKNDIISYNFKNLLDNLANGIAIFHINANFELYPMICNSRLCALLNIQHEDFVTHMGIANGYALHPEDLVRATDYFKEAIQTFESSKDVFRIITGDGIYRYISVFFNIQKIDDEYDLYCIFSDAEESDYLARIQANRRRMLIQSKVEASEKDITYIVLDITHNKCIERFYSHTDEEYNNDEVTAQSIIDDTYKDIAISSIAEEFAKNFNVEAFKEDVLFGEMSKEMRVPFKRDNRAMQWYRLNSELFFDEITGNSGVFLTFEDIDNDVRLENMVTKMLDSEFEYLCQIDVLSRETIMYGKIEADGEYQEHNISASYDELMPRDVQELLPGEYFEVGMKDFSLDNVIYELENNEIFRTVYPVNAQNGRPERVCQWSYEYVDDTHSIILMNRKSISKYLEYGRDALTGLTNRYGFYRIVNKVFNENPYEEYFLIEVDFDNFSLLNQEYGYDEGKRFLRYCALHVYMQAKEFDKRSQIGHFESDCFTVLLPKSSGRTPEEYYEKINEKILEHPTANMLKLRFGVYDVSDKSKNIEYICECCSIALHDCKGRFDKVVNYYSDDLKNRILEEQTLASEMQNAIDTQQFEVWFQPQINYARHKTLVGAEALVRWRHPTKGMIPPGYFIPSFEKNGFIYQLDKFVWNSTCKTIRKWMDEGHAIVPISINISRYDIMQDDFVDTLTNIVENYDIPKEYLHLEVTESAFSENTGTVVDVTNELINRGFIIAIDDFGSGYSSLSMLKNVPAQILKLDMHFFDEKEDSTRNECIIESVIRMAKMLGMAVLAEGVEKIEQANMLNVVGCDYIQGYLFSKPLPYDDFVTYMEDSISSEVEQAQYKTAEEIEKEMSHSHELFHSIIAGTNDIIIVGDLKTKQLLYANKAAEQFYGKRFDPMQLTTCKEFCNQDELCKDCPANKVKYGERYENMLVENGRHMKGHYSKMEWNGHEAFVYYLTDVTIEMQEMAFADELVRNVPCAMIIFDKDESNHIKMDYISMQAVIIMKFVGFEGEDPTLDDCISYIHPEDRDYFINEFVHATSANYSFHNEFRMQKKNGEIIWLEIILNPVADKNGHYKYYGVFTDVTERKGAQERVDNILQRIPTAMSVHAINEEGITRIFISENAKMILDVPNISHGVIDMKPIFDKIYKDDRETNKEFILDCVSSRKPFTIDLRVSHDKDSYRWVRVASTPILRDNFEYYFYTLYTDITAEREIAQARFERQRVINAQETINIGLQEAIRMNTTQKSIEYIIEYIGKNIGGDRAYIFEKNPDGTDSNTYEWVAEGVIPEKENLQNIPEEVAAPWYEQFKNKKNIVWDDINKIKDDYPLIYEALKPQGIRSIIVVPFFDNYGTPIGFFGLDNPPKEVFNNSYTFMQTIAFFIEASLKRHRLEVEVNKQVEEIDTLTKFVK